MDTGKNIIEAEKRVKRSKEIIVEYDKKNHTFKVTDMLGNLRYKGFLGPNKHYWCECKSYEFGNTPEYYAEHGYNFQCKHIMAALKKANLKVRVF